MRCVRALSFFFCVACAGCTRAPPATLVVEDPSVDAPGVEDLAVYAAIHTALKVRYLLLLVFFAGLCATAWMYQHVPTGFIPQEDQGTLMVLIQAPPGSSLAYTTALAERAEHIIAQNPDVAGAFEMLGFSYSGSASNSAMMYVAAKPSDQRRGRGHSTADILADLGPKLRRLMFVPNGGLVAMVLPPAVQGVRS